MSFDKPKFEPDSESEEALMEEFKTIIRDENKLTAAAESLYESLVEDSILGVAFQMHFESKHPKAFAVMEPNDSSYFMGSNNNKLPTCKCLNCDKTVSVSKYAPHLEKCMGLGRNSSRIASQRIRKPVNNSSSYFEYEDGDDAEDVNWTGKEKSKKKFTMKNGKSKNKT